MTLRKKVIIVICAAAVLIIGILAGIYAVKIAPQLRQTEHSFWQITYKIPEGSLYLEHQGGSGEVFRTWKSEAEIQKFYDDYFATLTPVEEKSRPGHTAYYDPERQVIYEDITTIRRGGLFPTEFIVWIWSWDGTGDQVTILDKK